MSASEPGGDLRATAERRLRGGGGAYEEIVGGDLLVLVTREEGLDHHMPLKAEGLQL
jgi:hypothetical protein